LGGRKGIRPVKKWGWWRWALINLDGVVPSRMVGVSASVDLPLHHKVQKFSSSTGSHGWSRKKGRKIVMVVVVDKGGNKLSRKMAIRHYYKKVYVHRELWFTETELLCYNRGSH